MALNQTQQSAVAWIDTNRARLSDFNRGIWNFAEPAWREYKSARAYCDLLRAEGFTVEEGSGGMPTAFAATWGSGSPVLGSYAEYDAVPGQSQQVVPYKAPRGGLHPWTAGHTDPHSSLGTAAVAGILATKAAMQLHGLRGTLKFFGEPAEKVCGSKPVHAAKGYYDGCDAFIAYHPHTANTVQGETQCGAYWSVVITFETLTPEQWIDKSLLPIRTSAHAAARCPGAIDALCLMYTTTKYTKEAMYPHAGAWTLNEFILAGGDATSDNLPPRFSQIQYSWRSPSLAVQQQIYQVLANNARHAAAVCGCQASVPMGYQDARRPAEQHDDRPRVSEHGSDRRAVIRRRGTRVRASDSKEPRHRADGRSVRSRQSAADIAGRVRGDRASQPAVWAVSYRCR